MNFHVGELGSSATIFLACLSTAVTSSGCLKKSLRTRDASLGDLERLSHLLLMLKILCNNKDDEQEGWKTGGRRMVLAKLQVSVIARMISRVAALGRRLRKTNLCQTFIRSLIKR